MYKTNFLEETIIYYVIRTQSSRAIHAIYILHIDKTHQEREVSMIASTYKSGIYHYC